MAVVHGLGGIAQVCFRLFLLAIAADDALEDPDGRWVRAA
jgi:hypothetical protein